MKDQKEDKKPSQVQTAQPEESQEDYELDENELEQVVGGAEVYRSQSDAQKSVGQNLAV